MDIKLPYNIGDTLWIVDFFSYTREVTCRKCKSGKVTLADGTEMSCGLCYGRGTHCVNFPYKGRPVQVKITGLDIYNARPQGNPEMDVWWYTNKRQNFSRTADFVRTFLEARKLARELNKKYGWPKKDFIRDPYEHTHKMFWGYRVPGSLRK